MGCLLWFQNLIHFLPLLSQCHEWYHDKLDRVITALDCNKSDLRPHHDRLTSSRPSRAIRKSIGINPGPRTTTTARPPCYTCVRTPTHMWCFATDLRPRRGRLVFSVSLGRRLHEMTISRVTCDRFTTVLDDIRDNRVNYDQPTKTWDQRRIQLRVESLACEIDKFHDRFWRLKAIVELVDFNGK